MPVLPKAAQDKYGEKAVNDTFSVRLFVWKFIKNAVPENNNPLFNHPGLEQE